jgi:hypothetical protein
MNLGNGGDIKFQQLTPVIKYTTILKDGACSDTPSLVSCKAALAKCHVGADESVQTKRYTHVQKHGVSIFNITPNRTTDDI